MVAKLDAERTRDGRLKHKIMKPCLYASSRLKWCQTSHLLRQAFVMCQLASPARLKCQWAHGLSYSNLTAPDISTGHYLLGKWHLDEDSLACVERDRSGVGVGVDMSPASPFQQTGILGVREGHDLFRTISKKRPPYRDASGRLAVKELCCVFFG